MYSLSAQALPQGPWNFCLFFNKAVVALAIGALPASALLPGTQAAAQVTVSPSSISWAKVDVGNTGGPKSATLTNQGSSAISISSIGFVGADPHDFAIYQKTCGSTLAASASCTATIVFKPTTTGTRTASLAFTDSGSNSPQEVSFSGLGASATSTGTATVSPTSINWGSVTVGNAGGQKSATLTNTGSTTINISSIAFTGTNAGDFTIYKNTCGTTLAASSSCTTTILFKPTAAGTRTATLTYSDNASNSPQEVSVTGLGAASTTPTTYYVSNCGTIGSDANKGTSASTPWLTIAKVNSSTFNPGDTIEFHDGCTWREQLTLPSAGTASHPITVSTYGSGNPPIISGSQVIKSWTAEPQSAVNFTSDSNLKAYWTMDQMSGSSFLDSSANGNTLTNINGATQSTNHVQGSYSAAFTASRDMELSRSDATLSAGFPSKSGTTNTSITVGGWVNCNSINPSTSFVLKGTGKSWGLFLGVGSNTGRMEWQTYMNSADRLVASNNVLVPGTWYHVVGRVDGATDEQAIFINGVKQSQTYKTSGAALLADTTPLQVGGIGSNYLDGKVDELFVFNRALSDSEIASIYTSRLDGSDGSYSLYYTGASTSPFAVYENGSAMTYVAEKTGMTPGSWYWDAMDARVYIRPTGDVDPSTETLEIPQRLTCITDSRNYTVITGLTCQEPSERGVYVTGANVTVQNMIINDVRENGPNSPNLNSEGVGVFWEGNNDIVQNNTVANANWGIFSFAVAPQTVSSGLIQRNTVYNIGYDGIGFGVKHPDGGVVTNSIAQYNVLHDIGIYNLEGGAIECIYAGATLGVGNTFRYNLMYNIGNSSRNSFPMNVQGGAGNCSFYGNVVYNSYGPCMEIATGPGGNRFYNNTCYNNGLGGREGSGIFIDGGSGDTGNIFENNIFYAGPNTTFTDVTGGSTSNTLDHNVYYGGTSTPFVWNGTTYSMSNYLAASGQDAHSLYADPLFTSPSTNNFSLTSSSPAIGAGTNMGATYQFDLAPGSVWPSNVSTAAQNTNGAWDIGAYVYPQ